MLLTAQLEFPFLLRMLKMRTRKIKLMLLQVRIPQADLSAGNAIQKAYSHAY